MSLILQPLKPAMTVPVVRRCPDGHYRRIIYDLAAFIADYPEQVLLACIVLGWCPKYGLSKLIFSFAHAVSRCLAPSDRLDDDPNALPRTRDFTDRVCSLASPAHLWDHYGIDSDVVVSFRLRRIRDIF